VKPGEVAAIEADRELAVVGRGQGEARTGEAAGSAFLRGEPQVIRSGGAMDPEKTLM
jgi:hypothetical protein